MEDKLFNYEELLKLIKKKWWLILLIIVVVTGAAIKYALGMQYSYYCTEKVLLSTSDNEIAYYTSEEVEAYTTFMNSYMEIIKAGDYLDTYLKKSKIDKTSSEIKNLISYTAATSTPLYTVTYSTYEDSKDNEKILDMLVDNLEDQVEEVVPEVKVTKIEGFKSTTIAPNRKKVVLVGFAASLVIALGVILVLDYLDDTIKSKEQLERILAIPVLGDIPTTEKKFKREDKKDVHSKSNAKVDISRVI